ncbi:MAG: PAS domain-containing protein, partial [Bdellovibrionota bacterium]
MQIQESKFFDLAQELLAVYTTDGVIVRTNAAWSKRLGRDPAAMVGRNITEFVDAEAWTDQRLAPAAASLPSLIGKSVICSIAQEIDDGAGLVYFSASPLMEFEEETASRWRRALEGTIAGYWDFDTDTQRVYFSAQYYRMLGYEPFEFPPSFESWVNILHPDDLQRSLEYYERFKTDSDSNFRLEFRLRAKDGTYRWMSSVGAAARDRNGKLLHNSGWNFDITEKVVALEKLKESEERCRNLIGAYPDLIAMLDRDGTYLEVHAHNCPLKRFIPADIVGRSIFDLIPHEAAVVRLAAIRDAIDNGRSTTTYFDLPVNGEQVYFENRITPSANGMVLLISRDITESRKAESERREFEERLRVLSQNVPGMIFQFQTWADGRTSFPYVNEKAFEVLGVSPAELKERGHDGVNPPFAHGDDAPGLRAAFRNGALTKTTVDWEGRAFVASGECKWFRIVATPRKLSDGSMLW